jgi:porin
VWISNIATDEALKIYEFWYQHSFMDESVSVLFGLHDYNSTFYTLESAGLFTHPPFGIGPDTSQVGPSIFLLRLLDYISLFAVTINIYWLRFTMAFPVIRIIRAAPISSSIAATVYSVRPNGAGQMKRKDKVGLGVWQQTAEVENPVNGELIDDNKGVYFIAEKNINDVVAIFIQLGQAEAELNQLEYYGGMGITFASFWLEGDGLGLAVGQARNGDPYLAANNELRRAETAWEFTYFAPLVEHVSAQASVYYIQNPLMDRTLEDAVALGARVYIEF